MSTIKNLLEKLDTMTSAAKKPAGPKFPGYWKGNDPASKAKSRMVGSAQESIIPEIHRQAKEGSIERRLKESLKEFKKVNEKVSIGPDAGPIYTTPTGITQNAPADTVRDSSGRAVMSGDGTPVRTGYKVPPTNTNPSDKG